MTLQMNQEDTNDKKESPLLDDVDLNHVEADDNLVANVDKTSNIGEEDTESEIPLQDNSVPDAEQKVGSEEAFIDNSEMDALDAYDKADVAAFSSDKGHSDVDSGFTSDAEKGEKAGNERYFPTLPDRKPIDECLRIDSPVAKFGQSDFEGDIARLDEISKSYRKTSNNFLLESKYSDIRRNFESKDIKQKDSINSGSEHIKKTFHDIKNTAGGFGDMFGYQIDWEFWTKVVNDYQKVIEEDSDELNLVLTNGIPKEFRGIIWQLIAKSKNFQLEEFYLSLKTETSIHEKSIKRDLTRTSFFTNVEQVNKGDELFNVIKAYSLFDPDVGYTQGMIFITVPLIMNMNESECFCLLVTLMKDYNLRSLFCPEMKGLHLLLYEFDRLLEENQPLLFNHLAKQGIKSSMYASQWFLTFFAYKFPLEIVLRIYDIIITQGLESILKFAVNLMEKNENYLLALNFDQLVNFLKDSLFNCYVNEEFHISNQVSEQKSRRFSILGGKKDSASQKAYYNLNAFVQDSMAINVDPLVINRYEAEFDHIYANEKEKAKEIKRMQFENGKLRREIKSLEVDYAHLNIDHIEVVQKMVDIKVTLPEILGDNEDLAAQITTIHKDIKELESKIEISDSGFSLPSNIEVEIQRLLEINAEEIEKAANKEEELKKYQDEEAALDVELDKYKATKGWFSRWK